MQNNKPLFSIIVPIYKVEQYIERCVQSILCQSYNNFELILIDDGSPDNCGAICRKYASIDKRIRLIHQKNKGISGARNTGLSLAEGEYLYFIDSDDWIEKNTLNILAKEIKTNYSDVIIFGYTEVTSDTKIKIRMAKEAAYKFNLDVVKENLICDKWRNYVWNKCFKRKLFVGETFPNGQVFEDLYIIPSIVYKAESISVIPDILYNYNKDNISSITSKTNSRKEYDFLLAVLKNYKLAKTEKLPYAEFCRSSVIEQAQKTLYIYIKDGLLDEEKYNLVENYCIKSLIDSINDPERRYKCFRNAAMIEFRKKNIIQCINNMYQYVINKAVYKFKF